MTFQKNKTVNLIIWDMDSKFEIPGKESSVIMNEEEFGKTKCSDFDVIFILAELGWKSRTEFYGFKVAKKLRLENKLMCPIVFCSFLSESQLFNFPESKILRRPGHYFLRLPDEKPEFEKYTGIDEDLLEDINGDLFDTHQFIREIVHNIPGALINVIEAEGNKNLNNVLSVLEYLLEPIKKLFSSKELSDKFGSIEKKVYEKTKTIINQKGFETGQLYSLIDSNDFIQLIPLEENEDNTDWVQRKWQVLFIDDEKVTSDKIISLFEQKNVTCHSADSAISAFVKLKEDAKDKNLISVIISDYRLYENGDSDSNKWQKMQGLQILKHIYYHPDFKNHYAYVIFTQKGSLIKNQITKQQKFQMLWFNKRDVLGGGEHSFNIFCNRINEIGDEAFNRKHATPQTKLWTTGSSRVTPGLDFYYRLHIDSADYQIQERKINEFVLSEIQSISNSLNNHHRARLSDKYDFQCSLLYKKEDQNEQVLLEKFRTNILIPRRIFWLLLKHFKKNGDEIIAMFGKDGSQKASIFNTSLGLSDYKNYSKANFSMLYEEKNLYEEYCTTH